MTEENFRDCLYVGAVLRRRAVFEEGAATSRRGTAAAAAANSRNSWASTRARDELDQSFLS